MSGPVQVASGVNTSGGTATLGTNGSAFGANVSSGNTIHGYTWGKGSGTSGSLTVTPSGTASFGTLVTIQHVNAASSQFQELYEWYLPVTGSGTCSISTSISTQTSGCGVVAAEWALSSTPYTSGECNGNNTYSGGSTAQNSGQIPSAGGSLAESNGILVGFSFNQSTNAASAAAGGATQIGTYWAALGSACATYEYLPLSSSANLPNGSQFTGNYFVQQFTLGSVLVPSSGGGGVTETLSGQAITSTEGTITSAVAYGLTGQSIASSLGTITPTITYAVTGQSITSTEGTPTPAVSYGLTGQSITSTEGTIAPTVSYGLTGQSITSTEGTISASQGGDVTTSLSGQAITSTLGTITPTITYAVTGQSITSTEGTPTPAVSYGLTGQSITSTEGTITSQVSGNVTIQLTGLSMTATLGQISALGGDVPTGGGGGHRRKQPISVPVPHYPPFDPNRPEPAPPAPPQPAPPEPPTRYNRPRLTLPKKAPAREVKIAPVRAALEAHVAKAVEAEEREAVEAMMWLMKNADKLDEEDRP